jgi:hypothetical protein
MIEQEHTSESESYPIVEVTCDHCQKKFAGKIGPIISGESYPLHLYQDQIVGNNKSDQILAWNLPPERRYVGAMLLNHHYTVRDGSQGHYQYTVLLGGQKVGIIRVSTSAQFFLAD